MTKTNFLRISLTRKETQWGIRYLLFQIAFLPSLLGVLDQVLPFSLNTTQLNFLFFCANFTAALLIFRRYLGEFLRLGMADALRIGWVSVAFWAAYWLSTALLTKVLTALVPDFVNQNDQSIAAMSGSHYALMFLGTVFLVPVAEECFHRGLVFRSLYSRSGVAAFLVSAAVFSAVHIVNYIGSYTPAELAISFVQYLPAGFCLAGAYRLSGSLISPILIHMAINAMGMLALR